MTIKDFLLKFALYVGVIVAVTLMAFLGLTVAVIGIAQICKFGAAILF